MRRHLQQVEEKSLHGRSEAEARWASWKSWSDAYSLTEAEEQVVLADLFALEDAFSTSMTHKRA
jgi:hypothetical protein